MRFAIGVVIAAILLSLVLRNVQLHHLLDTLADADGLKLTSALIAVMVGYACRVERWRLMLLQENPRLTWIDCAGPLIASFAANNVLPLRAGDAIRAVSFNTDLGTTAGVVVATLLVERMLDLFAILGVLGCVLILVDLSGTILHSVSVEGGALLLVCLGLLLVLLARGVVSPRIFASLGMWVSRWVPRIGSRVANEIVRGGAVLQHSAVGKRVVVLWLWSIAAWVSEGLAYWVTATSIPILTNPSGGWLALPVSALATLVPSAPGHVGTFDYFAQRAMITVGNDASSAAVYALLVHVVIWLPPTVIGGLYLMFRVSVKARE